MDRRELEAGNWGEPYRGHPGKQWWLRSGMEKWVKLRAKTWLMMGAGVQ